MLLIISILTLLQLIQSTRVLLLGSKSNAAIYCYSSAILVYFYHLPPYNPPLYSVSIVSLIDLYG